jgi:hypothetical protein
MAFFTVTRQDNPHTTDTTLTARQFQDHPAYAIQRCSTCLYTYWEKVVGVTRDWLSFVPSPLSREITRALWIVGLVDSFFQYAYHLVKFMNQHATHVLFQEKARFLEAKIYDEIETQIQSEHKNLHEVYQKVSANICQFPILRLEPLLKWAYGLPLQFEKLMGYHRALHERKDPRLEMSAEDKKRVEITEKLLPSLYREFTLALNRLEHHKGPFPDWNKRFVLPAPSKDFPYEKWLWRRWRLFKDMTHELEGGCGSGCGT